MVIGLASAFAASIDVPDGRMHNIPVCLPTKVVDILNTMNNNAIGTVITPTALGIIIEEGCKIMTRRLINENSPTLTDMLGEEAVERLRTRPV